MEYDASDWKELNTSSAAEFEQKRQWLKAFISEQRPVVEAIDSFDAYFEFCKAFQEKAGVDRPIDITDYPVDQDALNQLEQYGYPADFMEWQRSYGHLYFWIESTKLQPTSGLIDELTNDYYGLLTQNRFLFLTSDGGGNGFFYDLNTSPPEIKFADHVGYFSSDEYSIEEFYSEEMGFWYDEEKKALVNEKNLDTSKIYTEDKDYRLDSEYIYTYLAENLESTGITSFLDFLKKKTLEGFDDVLQRYGVV